MDLKWVSAEVLVEVSAGEETLVLKELNKYLKIFSMMGIFNQNYE
jgi:hypothetical protein